MQLWSMQNSTGCVAYKLMFGRSIRTRPHIVINDFTPNSVVKDNVKRQFSIGDKIHSRDYSNRNAKWNFRNVITREGL